MPIGNINFTDTYGEPFNVTVANPGAGNDFSYTLPAGYTYVPMSVDFLFATDATAVSRYVRIVLAGTNFSCTLLANYNHTASVTRRYNFSVNRGTLGGSMGSSVNSGLPLPVIMQAGETISSLIEVLQAGDAVTSITLKLGRWINA